MNRISVLTAAIALMSPPVASAAAPACMPGNPPIRMSPELQAEASDVVIVRVDALSRSELLCMLTGTVVDVERGNKFERGAEFVDHFRCGEGWVPPPEHREVHSIVPVVGENVR